MYKVIYTDSNGCKEEVGEFFTEKEARAAAEAATMGYCLLEEQINHCIQAFNLPSSTTIYGFLKIANEIREGSKKEYYFSKAKDYCENEKQFPLGVVTITNRGEFLADYWSDLAFDERGFYYEVWNNA